MVKKEYFTGAFALYIPERQKQGKRVWIHAISIGEALSSRPLIKAIKKPVRREEMGKNTWDFVHRNNGAVNRIIDVIGGDIASN